MAFRSSINTLFIAAVIFSGCAGSKNTASKKTQPSIRLVDSLVKKQAKGIDYFAEGDQPIHWSLEMDVDNGYKFSAANGISIRTPAIRAVQRTDIAARSYTYSNSQGEIDIFVFDANCDNNPLAKKVEVTVNNTRYTGCGKYLYDASLNDKWNLQSINNVQYVAKDFSKGLPWLKFDIATNKLTGSDGCGNISSAMTVMGNRIEFGAINPSSGSCKNADMRKTVAEKLSGKIASYFFKEGKLYLYLIDDSMMIFTKA